eukprot:2631733-Rhodomonas_salina.2
MDCAYLPSCTFNFCSTSGRTPLHSDAWGPKSEPLGAVSSQRKEGSAFGSLLRGSYSLRVYRPTGMECTGDDFHRLGSPTGTVDSTTNHRQKPFYKSKRWTFK